jgi:hypothetical protein
MIYSGSGPDFLIPSRYGSISSPDPSLKLGKVKKASETHQPKTYQDSLNANMIKKFFSKMQYEYQKTQNLNPLKKLQENTREKIISKKGTEK